MAKKQYEGHMLREKNIIYYINYYSFLEKYISKTAAVIINIWKTWKADSKSCGATLQMPMS